MTSTSAPPRRKGLSRKIRAILAGGLVLGLGTAATLAAWNDSEYATGTFTAGTFNLQGATAAAAGPYTDHASSAGAAAVTFSTGFDNMSPGTVVAAPFWVRLAANTTTPATLDLVDVTSTGANAANITFVVRAIAPGDTCNTATTGGTVLTPTTPPPLTTGPIAGDTAPLAIGSPASSPGTAVQLCIIATAGTNLVQGGAVTSVWRFQATSTS